MIEYENIKTALAEPEASSMIETFRAIGYSIETAIADLIDNSISAEAKNIWISFNWDGEQTAIFVKDDGYGMTNNELVQAMRPGCKNPTENRSINDLGRFGLGLKTASFSQCRKFTVVSKKNDYPLCKWTWDMDHVCKTGKWELVSLNETKSEISDFENQTTGTILIWENIDRLLKDVKINEQKDLEKFLETMESVKKHISMVFHRFLEKNKIKIWFQDREVTPWNPFMIDEQSTQMFPEENLNDGDIKIKGYVIPHKSKLSSDKFKYGEGIYGWNGHQGFYIYRNDRLLVAGDWLGLFRKEEHYKLARIAIDITNNLDEEWQIDIKKSVARLPSFLRNRIKAYASGVRNQAVEIYRHRGKTVKVLPGQVFIPLWLEHKRGDKWYYKINRQHPILINSLEQAKTEPQKAIETLIRFIEETIPSKSIYIKEASDEEAIGKSFERIDQEPIRKLMIQMYTNLIDEGKDIDRAKSIIMNIEPFNNFPHLIEQMD